MLSSTTYTVVTVAQCWGANYIERLTLNLCHIVTWRTSLESYELMQAFGADMLSSSQSVLIHAHINRCCRKQKGHTKGQH